MSSKFVDQEYKLGFEDVLIVPRRTSYTNRHEGVLIREFVFTNTCKNVDISLPLIKPVAPRIWKGVPLIASNMDITGTFEVYKVLSEYKMITAFTKSYTLCDYIDAVENKRIVLDPDFFMVSTGITDHDIVNLIDIIHYTKCRWICIDVANGYMNDFLKFCGQIRQMFPDKIIVAGNVVSHEMAERLFEEAGVDIVKIGIGNGKIGVTCKQTGVGMPQLSAILDAKQPTTLLTTTSYKNTIISEGGIRCPGDVAKAFAAGAEFVIIGGEFAGHDENVGDLVLNDKTGELTKNFYGMKSALYLLKLQGNKEDIIKTPYRGPLKNTVLYYLSSLRSALSYLGAKNLFDFEQKAKFVLVK
jgi:GMP reductase